MEDTAPEHPLHVERERGEFDTIEVSERREHNPWIVLTSTSLAVFAVFLDTTIGFVAFPAISETFSSAGASTVSWVLNAYTLVFAALLIPAGRLADRIGRRRMFLSGVVVFTVGSMLCGLSPTVGVLIGAEMLEAVGAAMLVPASLALVLQTFPREKVPVAVAIWGAIGAVAGAFGPTLGALVVSNLSWRWAFFINLPVGIVSFFLGRAVLPEGKEANPGRIPDPASVAVLAAGIALVVYAVVETEHTGWASGRFVGVLTAGLVLLALFVDRCRRVPNPLIHLELFRSQNFRWANAAMMVYAVAFSAMFLGNVLFLTRVWDYSILRAGLAISVGPLIVAVTAPFLGRLAGRIGQRSLLIPGGVVWALGAAILLLRATDTPAYLERVPAGEHLHRPRRRPGAAAAVVGRRPGPARRPVRRRLGRRPGAALPRLDDRRRPRHRPPRRPDRRSARRVPPRVVAARRLRADRVRAVDAARPATGGHAVTGERGDRRPRRRLTTSRGRRPLGRVVEPYAGRVALRGPRPRWWRPTMVGYVSLVAVLAVVATADPNDQRIGAFRAVMVLCLPAMVAVLPVLYVVVSTVINVTSSDDGGVTWPVTVSYVVLFVAAAMLNCLLLERLLRRRLVAT